MKKRYFGNFLKNIISKRHSNQEKPDTDDEIKVSESETKDNDEIQEKNKKIKEILNLAKKDKYCFDIIKLWERLDSKTQSENLEKIISLPIDASIIEKIWITTHPRAQRKNAELLLKIMKSLVEDNYCAEALRIWMNTDENLKKEKILEAIELTMQESFVVARIFINIPEKLQKEMLEKVIDLVKEKAESVAMIWSCTKVQEEYSKILPRLIELTKDDIYWAIMIWNNTKPNVQKENETILMEIVDLAKQDIGNLVSIWGKTVKEIQENNIEKVINLVQENNYNVGEMWQCTDADVQLKNFDTVLNIVKDHSYNVEAMWENTKGKVNAEKLETIINLVKEKRYNIEKIWNGTGPQLKEENVRMFLDVIIPDKIEQNVIIDRLEKIHNKNINIYETINLRFLCDSDLFNQFDDEQILRITNYREVQEFIVKYKNNKYIYKMILKVCDTSQENNWIISLNRIKENVNKYQDLLNTLQNDYDGEEISDEFIEKLLSIVSGTENYFNIKTAEDVENFYKIREEKALKILRGDTTDISQVLSKYSQSDLYKFALLEYKFGIDLEEARRLLEIYGEDVKELIEQAPEDMKDYAKFLEAIKITIESENIVEIVNENIEKIGEPWKGYPNAREAEGKIINIFEEIYNRVLYKPEEHEEDRDTNSTVYIDENGQEHEIAVYNISNDFQMNIRVEGAYSFFIEPESFVEHYNIPNISNHGNCESFIRSDEIAIAKNEDNNVMVGYSQIRKNSLVSMGTYDLGSDGNNRQFYAYSNGSSYRIPNKMIDNTRPIDNGMIDNIRPIHNEMVKDRIMIDEEGHVIKSTPDYAVWMIEDREEDKNREQDERWICTKKLASQLNIPIVVIDREKFAEREQNKVDKMIEIVLSGKNNIADYEEYFNKEEIERYKGLSAEQLASEILIKFDNNRIGVQFSDKLNRNYFYMWKREKIEKIISLAKEKEQPHTEQEDTSSKLLKLYFESEIGQIDVKNVTQQLRSDIDGIRKPKDDFEK